MMRAQGEAAIKNRDYQMLLFGNVLRGVTDLQSFWHSSERFHPGANLSLYNSKEADALIDKIRHEADTSTLPDLFTELQRVIVDDFPAIFLYAPDYLYLTGKDVKGLDPKLITEPADRFQSVALWHLKTKRVLK